MHPRLLLGLVAVGGCAFTPSGATDGDLGPDARPPGDLGPDAGPGNTALCPGYTTLATGTYRLVESVATWEQARTDCGDDVGSAGGGHRTHLVVLSSDAERLAVRAAFPISKLWIGLSDRAVTSQWHWVTAEDTGTYPPGSGAPWKPHQPNDGGGGDEDCVVMDSAGAWDDRRCESDTEAYVCECDTNADDDAWL